MAFNPELSCKALEKRVGALETAADRLEQQSRAAGECKAAKAVSDRLTKLEAVVKALAESRLDTKVDAMNKTLIALNTANLVDAETMHKLWKSREEKISEQHAKEAKAIADKAVADGMKNMEVVKMEVRLAQLEAKLMAMIAASSAR